MSSVVDLTILYGNYEKPTWKEVVFGRTKPMDVYIHVKVRPVPDITEDNPEVLGKWLRQVWSEKDALINAFLQNPKNVIGPAPRPLSTGGLLRMILIELFFLITGYLSVTLNFYFYAAIVLVYIVIAISIVSVLFIHKKCA